MIMSLKTPTTALRALTTHSLGPDTTVVASTASIAEEAYGFSSEPQAQREPYPPRNPG